MTLSFSLYYFNTANINPTNLKKNRDNNKSYAFNDSKTIIHPSNSSIRFKKIKGNRMNDYPLL